MLPPGGVLPVAGENLNTAQGTQSPQQSERSIYGQKTATGNEGNEILSRRPPPPRREGDEILPPIPRFGDLSAEQRAAGIEAVKQSDLVKGWVMRVFVALMGLTLLARFIRIYRSRSGMVEVVYASGKIVRAPAGPTLLDLARLNDLPHANLCQGRGRCGTCRVRILSSENPLEPAGDLELATLARYGSEEDVRLACQLSPTAGRIKIERMVAPDFAIQRADPPLLNPTVFTHLFLVGNLTAI